MPDRDQIWSNPTLGTRTFFHYDESDGDIILETVQDVETVIEANKKALNATDPHPQWGDGKLVASIPIVVMKQLVEEGILSPRWAILDEARFNRWLNDPENRFFRCFPGRV